MPALPTRPHFNFAASRYSAEWLALRTDLLGQCFWLQLDNEDDARFATVSSRRGHFLAVVRAAPPWHRTPHSLYGLHPENDHRPSPRSGTKRPTLRYIVRSHVTSAGTLLRTQRGSSGPSWQRATRWKSVAGYSPTCARSVRSRTSSGHGRLNLRSSCAAGPVESHHGTLSVGCATTSRTDAA